MTHRDAADRATRIQHLAARPDRSVAVRASAGSGKTRVLVDRFVRLCIEGQQGGVHPRSILAVTFTRKAATEIRERLLSRARGLALEPEPDVRSALDALFAGRPAGPASDVELTRARRLYEQLLEDPAGLQVGTIHSFCQRILSRFATEEGLDPHARLLEDRGDLEDEALDLITARLAGNDDLAELARDIAASPGGVRLAITGVLKRQMRVDRWLRRLAERAGVEDRPRAPLLPGITAELRAFLFPGQDLPDDLRIDHLVPALVADLTSFVDGGLDEIASDFAADELKRLTAGLDKLAGAARKALEDAARRGIGPQDVAARIGTVFLTKSRTIRSFTGVRDGELKDRFQQAVITAAGPVLRNLRSLDLVALYRRNRAQFDLGLRTLDLLDELKYRDRVLDFGDLEELACRLMGSEARALSLLFRLEDSIRHILVDEYQDTNANQSDLLAPFVDEFLAGGDPAGRTVFCVGDLKQSIYGFRGADPSIFARMIRRLEQRDQVSTSLPTNFRSLPAIVEGVGELFASDVLAPLLPAGEADHVRQAVARDEARGVFRVLTPFAAADEAGDARTAQQTAAAAAVRVAHRLVRDKVRTWDEDDPAGSRPLVWNDIIVLYRTRTNIALYERAFREAGIPIEPAGRGMLASSREVQDLLALLRWLAWPGDEVALAAVLRSPFFRLDEQRFQELLSARGVAVPDGEDRFRTPTNLWPTLRRLRDTDPTYGEAADRLERWRDIVGYVDCHELLRRVFRDGHVVERFVAAFGEQAGFNLERLYDLVLASDVAATPTVRKFIERIETADRRGGVDEGTAPRQEGRGRVRFMTIHGAKGLEAPVVLLVDADAALSEHGDEVRMLAEHPSSGLVLGVTKALGRGFDGAEPWLPGDPLQDAWTVEQRVAMTEQANLLYVALTRARDRLFVLGADGGHAPDRPPASFLGYLHEAVVQTGTTLVSSEDPPGLERPPEPVTDASARAAAAMRPVQTWSPPTWSPTLELVTPSAAAAVPEDGDGVDDFDAADVADTAPAIGARGDAVARGLRIHLYLQLAAERGAMPPGNGPEHAEAAAVFADPRLDWVFRPVPEQALGRSEVPVIARRPIAGDGPEERIVGIVDRLVVADDGVDIIDFKTNRWRGDAALRDELAAHYRPQLQAYAEALAPVFPGRKLRCWLLLTDPEGRGEAGSGLVEVS